MFAGFLEYDHVRLPSGSKYYGNSDSRGMQGYGQYIFPDGTKYTGSFKNNQFHGEGTMLMPNMLGVCFSVLHHEGKLKQISRISFTDNLDVDFKIDGDEISFDKWKYCTAQDRRFNGEILDGLNAVGPQTYQTAEGPNPMPLRTNKFDLGFCQLNRLGCVVDMPIYMSKTPNFYVGPRAVRRWIRENCRHGKLQGKQLKEEVLAKFARQILENNVRVQKELTGKPVWRSWKVCRRSSSVDSFFSSGRELTSDSSGSSFSSESSIVDAIQVVCKGECPHANRSRFHATSRRNSFHVHLVS